MYMNRKLKHNSFSNKLICLITIESVISIFSADLLKLKTYTALCRETLWIFSNADEI